MISVEDRIHLALERLISRELTEEEKREMEQKTRELDSRIGEMLKDRPRKYIPKALRGDK